MDAKYKKKIAKVALRSLNFHILDVIRSNTYSTFEQTTGLIKSGLGVRTGNLTGGSIASFIVENPQATISMGKVAFMSVARRPRASGLPPKSWVAFYWRFLEFGTQPRSLTSNGAYRGSGPERSWVRPSFQQAVGGALEAFKKLVKDMTDEACKELPSTVPGRGSK